MLSESARRAAALAVTRYGVDKVRVKEAARSAQRAQAEGQQTDLVTLLVDEKLLSPVQADEIRLALDKTHLDLDRQIAASPAKQTRIVSVGKGPEADPVEAPDPRRVGDYQLLRQLGEGGMGSVYLGYQEKADRQVAIKLLSHQLTGNSSYVDRFKREARSVLHLDHPNIVRGIEVGEDPATATYFLVLEYVDGPSAHALLDRFGRLPVRDAVHIILDIARALEHAHSRNIIHRDIKPDNILLTLSGVAKLADLGLARRIDEDSHLTGARQSFGTPYYMPFEQSINARQADARSDIYALGATLYHLLTGEVPFPGASPLEVAEKKRVGDFTAAGAVNPEVPAALDQILSKMLAQSPRARYQTASQLIVDLERSGLAAPVPSFVDPELALQDPLVRERLTTVPVPTRLDLGSQMSGVAGLHDPELWYLRYLNKDGLWRKARATTQQIKQRLEEGRISRAVEACHASKGEFRPLGTYPEFCQLETAPDLRFGPGNHNPAETRRKDGMLKKGQARQSRKHILWLLPISLMLFITLAVLVYHFAF